MGILEVKLFFRSLAVVTTVILGPLCLISTEAWSYSANRVWFEFRPGGIYRVYVNYTVPELKEFRESYVEFRTKKAAERFYYDLLRGADFYPPAPEALRFTPPPKGPQPW